MSLCFVFQSSSLLVLKGDILKEVRKELYKVKAEIIDGKQIKLIMVTKCCHIIFVLTKTVCILCVDVYIFYV